MIRTTSKLFAFPKNAIKLLTRTHTNETVVNTPPTVRAPVQQKIMLGLLFYTATLFTPGFVFLNLQTYNGGADGLRAPGEDEED